MGSCSQIRMFLRACLLAVSLHLSAADAAWVPDPAVGTAIKDPLATGIDHGLCAVVVRKDGAGTKLIPKFASTGHWLVHGLAIDTAALTAARKATADANQDGVVTIESIPAHGLPYRDHLVNLLVIDDLDAAIKAGCTLAEAGRILAPGGRLCVMAKNAWTVLGKPMPATMDDWTHDMHGPDGNGVSKDQMVHWPLGYRWNADLPMNLSDPAVSSNWWTNTRGMALWGGRCFTLSTSALDNLAPAYWMKQGKDHFVTARDAFNGILLWRRRIGPTFYGGLYYLDQAPFVVASGYVFLTGSDGKLLMLNAITGDVERSIPTTFAPGKIVVEGDRLIVATWKGATSVGPLSGVDRRRFDFAIEQGTVEAYEIKSGKSLWKRDQLATSLRAMDDTAFMLCRVGRDAWEETPPPDNKPQIGGPKRPPQTVVAADLMTGAVRWKVTSESLGVADDYLRIDAVGLGTVAVMNDSGQSSALLSAKDGSVLTRYPSARAAFHQGSVHVAGQRYNPSSGKAEGGALVDLGKPFCTPRLFVNGILIDNRVGGLIVDGKRINYFGVRGACLFASIPAFGSLFTAQNWCTCAPGQIAGLVSSGPIATLPTSDEMEKSTAPEPGPAAPFKAPAATPGKPGTQWPCFRADAERSNSTVSFAPAAELEPAWATSVIPPAALTRTALSRDWEDAMASVITTPVIADGVLVVADSDRHQVVALNASTGARKWRFIAAARIDSSPTLYQGLCLFGCHDGWLYALALADGRLVWRLPVAPRDERMVSYAQVESPWPVVGSVLISDGMAIASAGRSMGSDGGVVVRAVDPLNGTVIWSRCLDSSRGAQETRRNDLLVKTGDDVQLMLHRMVAKTGVIDTVPVNAPEPMVGSAGFLCGDWPRLGNRKLQSMSFGNVGEGSGVQVAWNTKAISVIQDLGRCVLVFDRSKAHPAARPGVAPSPFDQSGVFWVQSFEQHWQATSMVLCADAVVIGGTIHDSKDGKGAGHGFVQVRSLANKGQVVHQRIIDVPVVLGGIAVAGGRIYASLHDGTVVCLGR